MEIEQGENLIMTVSPLSIQELEAGLEHILESPKEAGRLEMIVRRPQVDEREVLPEGRVDTINGLDGDNWRSRGSTSTPDGSASIEAQMTLMNSRVIQLLTQKQEEWPLAGDQLFVDMDLSIENLPPGTQISIGTAVLEVSAKPHTGCSKFSSRFGLDALKFISLPERKGLRLRGINARVVQAGVFKTGDMVRRI